ncbi:MAG: S8 family serine peptidase [Deltaproteobacteria bacterium]|nr:S8 family serine peptidase [Deltaproteobacteria bacterium]
MNSKLKTTLVGVALMLGACTASEDIDSRISTHEEALDSRPTRKRFAFDRIPAKGAPNLDNEKARGLAKKFLVDGEKVDQIHVEKLEHTGRAIVTAAILDEKGDSRIVVLDETGVKADPQAMHRTEAQASRQRHGKLSGRLFRRLDTERPDKLPVVVSIDPPKIPSPRLDERLPPEEAVERYRKSMRDLLAPSKARAVELLQRLGAEDIANMPSEPDIHATLPLDSLLSEEFNTDATVAHVDEVDPPGKLYSFNGYRAMRGPLYGGMCEGNFENQCIGATWNFKAAILENLWGSTTTLDPRNPRIPRVNDANPDESQALASTCTKDADCSCFGDCGGYFCVNQKCVSQHATIVAGSIGQSGKWTAPGSISGMGETLWKHAGAPFFRALFANNSDEGGIDWASTKGAMFLNHSASLNGTSENPAAPLPRKFDWHARYDYMLITQASGNEAKQGVPADCESYNSLCVGSYYHGGLTRRDGTPTTIDDNSNDAVSSFSNWKNPVSGRELPHLVAPGESISTTVPCPSVWDSGFGGPSWVRSEFCADANTTWESSASIRGTSFSAPEVLGISMLLQDYSADFFGLALPVTKKAILLAGARDANQKETDDNNQPPSPISISQPTDGKDGAGSPDLAALKRILDAKSYRTLYVKPASFDASGYYTTSIPVTVPPGRALRVAIAWNSCPSSNSSWVSNEYTNRLGVDFDLRVDRPSDGNNQCGYWKKVSFFGSTYYIWVPGGSVWSQTVPSEYEMVYDACMATGAVSPATYTIRLRYKKESGFQLCNGATDETVALAWDLVPL